MNRFGKTCRGLAALIAFLQPCLARACTVCFGGASDSTVTQGMGWGIFTLLVVILSVLGGVALFFVHVARRAPALPATARAETAPTLKD